MLKSCLKSTCPSVSHCGEGLDADATALPIRIERITPEGIVAADGKERKVDIIVCATGFDCSWRPRFTLKGRKGYQIGDKWAEEPRSYMSIGIEEMPNYFIFNGPYNCGGNGAAIPPIEVEGDYSK